MLQSFTSAAICTGKRLASNSVNRPTPERPAVSRSQTSLISDPSGVTQPTPVMTTRLRMTPKLLVSEDYRCFAGGIANWENYGRFRGADLGKGGGRIPSAGRPTKVDLLWFLSEAMPPNS